MTRFPSAPAPVRLLLAISTAIAPLGASAQIIPTPNSGTTVSPGPFGRPTVSIAPAPTGGVSVNNYNQFSVAAAGANLDNRNVRANIIVNQVVSNHRSFLNGPVEVLGSRAHVVIANPNGLTVDGGSFINTGGVVLSGGTVRYDAAGAPIVPTGNGDIHVGPGGLSGAMTTLQLAAARLKIDGRVKNDHASPNADIALVAGAAELTLDRATDPRSTLRPLVKARKNLSSSSDEYLVEVTPNGYMSASRVNIAVSARGAGVSFAGKGESTIGEFRIDASGRIAARGAQITGERGIKLSGGSVEILNSPAAQSEMRANAGPVTVLARSSDIDIAGALSGDNAGSGDPDARGAVTLQAAGDIRLLTENAGRLALVYGSRGGVSVAAGGDLVNRDGRILANGHIAIRTSGTFENTTTIVDPVNGGAPTYTVKKKSFWLSWLIGKRKTVITTFDYGKRFIPDDRALVFGSSIAIDADTFINRGEISASNGSLAIAAREIRNEALWTGTIALRRQCGFVCRSRGETDIALVGGVMNAQFGLSINASQLLYNNGGQIVSYGDLRIDAPRVETYAAFVPAIFNRPAGLDNFWAGSRAWVAYQPAGGHIYAPVGTLTIASQTPLIADGGIVEGMAGTDIAPGLDRRRTFQNYGPVPEEPIGLFRDIVP